MKTNFILNKFSSKGNALSQSKGFTLIELLIVIAILGVLAAGILIAIDPVDKIKAANDAQVQNDISAIGRAAEAYATVHGGFYPRSGAAGIQDLVDTGELKRLPTSPYEPATSYNSSAFVLGANCTASGTCDDVTYRGDLQSKKYVDAATPVWRYEATTGKSCATTVALANDPGAVCP